MSATAGVSLIQTPAPIFPFFLMIPENYMLGVASPLQQEVHLELAITVAPSLWLRLP